MNIRSSGVAASIGWLGRCQRLSQDCQELLTTTESWIRLAMAWHDRVTQALRELPVLIGTREEAWQFLGFKHGNGPAKWSGFARSQ